MTTLEVEIAIMKHYGVRKNIIVPNISWGMFLGNRYLHECDLLILNSSHYATEIEVKVTKSDLIKDKEKMHGHVHNYIKYLWFAVPEKLKEVALQNMPDRAGLYILQNKHDSYYSTSYIAVEIIRKAKANKCAVKWSGENIMQLTRLGTMRILKLKQILLKL